MTFAAREIWAPDDVPVTVAVEFEMPEEAVLEMVVDRWMAPPAVAALPSLNENASTRFSTAESEMLVYEGPPFKLVESVSVCTAVLSGAKNPLFDDELVV